MSRLYRAATLLPLALLFACQASLQTNDWSTYDGPGQEHFLKEEVEYPHVDDPIEPLNRGIAGFNHLLLKGIVFPIGWVYKGIVPAKARTGILNAFDNLYFPVRLVGNLLQGKFAESGNETKRFAINTTVGVLGLRDAATGMGIEASREDTGQTMGSWGWDSSTYLVIPVLGPATIRDGLGGVVDAVIDPLTYVPPVTTVRSAAKLVEYEDAYNSFVETNFDPYQLGRLLFVLNRIIAIEDFAFTERSDDSSEAESLEAVFLVHEDPDFPGRGKTYDVRIPTTGRELPYTVWMQPEPAPMVYFIPGTGGHRLGGSSLAVAEIAYGNGNSVVTISSALNFEFIAAASPEAAPGFAPVDARNVHVAFDAIDHDLQERFPGRIVQRRLGGLSLGAMHTLLIAAAEGDADNDLVAFDVYVALNSPVNFRHSVEQLDAFYNAPLAYPADERRDRLGGILNKVLHLAEGGLQPGKELPFTAIEARYLIGLSFRKTLQDVIYQAQTRHDFGVLKTKGGRWSRANSYREISQLSFMEYVYAFVLPYYAERREDIDFSEAGATRLFEQCDLRSVAAELAANDKVRFFSNRNDFLLRPEDVRWIEDTFGDRAVLFDRGGHVGNLHRDDIQEAIRRVVKEAVEP